MKMQYLIGTPTGVFSSVKDISEIFRQEDFDKGESLYGKVDVLNTIVIGTISNFDVTYEWNTFPDKAYGYMIMWYKDQERTGNMSATGWVLPGINVDAEIAKLDEVAVPVGKLIQDRPLLVLCTSETELQGSVEVKRPRDGQNRPFSTKRLFAGLSSTLNLIGGYMLKRCWNIEVIK